MNIQHIIIFLLLTVFSFSCRPTRNISRVVHTKDSTQTACFKSDSLHIVDSAKILANILNQINHNIIDFKTFSAKIKIHYASNIEKNSDFTAFVRIQKDSIIWLSLTGALGIEGFRILITPNGLRIMDKLHKTIQNLPLTHLQEITRLPLDFNTLQNLIVGNPIFTDSKITSCIDYNSQTIIGMKGADFKQTISLDKPDNRIIQSKLDELNKESSSITCNISTTTFERKNNQWFAVNRNITILGKTQTDIILDTKSFNINESLSFPFNIPKSYSKK